MRPVILLSGGQTLGFTSFQILVCFLSCFSTMSRNYCYKVKDMYINMHLCSMQHNSILLVKLAATHVYECYQLGCAGFPNTLTNTQLSQVIPSSREINLGPPGLSLTSLRQQRLLCVLVNHSHHYHHVGIIPFCCSRYFCLASHCLQGHEYLFVGWLREKINRRQK